MDFEPRENDTNNIAGGNVQPESRAYVDPNEGASYTYGNYVEPGGPDQEKAVMSLGEWLLVILAGAIPCLGLVLYLVWAFGNTGNLNRRNYCRASLIIQVASTIVAVLFVMFFAVTTVMD